MTRPEIEELRDGYKCGKLIAFVACYIPTLIFIYFMFGRLIGSYL